jgi:hypothetical protein
MHSSYSRWPTASTAAVLLIALMVHAPETAAQDSTPDLTGAWSGHGTGAVLGQLGHQVPAAEPPFVDQSVIWTLTIEQQAGRGLAGIWNSPNHSERLLGVIRSDNETVHFVDEDTYFNGRVLSANEMEVCLQETGSGSMVATCYILERQSP